MRVPPCHCAAEWSTADGAQVLYGYIKDQPVWNSVRFWTAAYFDLLYQERASASGCVALHAALKCNLSCSWLIKTDAERKRSKENKQTSTGSESQNTPLHQHQSFLLTLCQFCCSILSISMKVDTRQNLEKFEPCVVSVCNTTAKMSFVSHWWLRNPPVLSSYDGVVE